MVLIHPHFSTSYIYKYSGKYHKHSSYFEWLNLYLAPCTAPRVADVRGDPALRLARTSARDVKPCVVDMDKATSFGIEGNSLGESQEMLSFLQTVVEELASKREEKHFPGYTRPASENIRPSTQYHPCLISEGRDSSRTREARPFFEVDKETTTAPLDFLFPPPPDTEMDEKVYYINAFVTLEDAAGNDPPPPLVLHPREAQDNASDAALAPIVMIPYPSLLQPPPRIPPPRGPWGLGFLRYLPPLPPTRQCVAKLNATILLTGLRCRVSVNNLVQADNWVIEEVLPADVRAAGVRLGHPSRVVLRAVLLSVLSGASDEALREANLGVIVMLRANIEAVLDKRMIETLFPREKNGTTRYNMSPALATFCETNDVAWPGRIMKDKHMYYLAEKYKPKRQIGLTEKIDAGRGDGRAEPRRRSRDKSDKEGSSSNV